MVMIRCSDCSWLFYHRLVAVSIHVVLTGSDRLEGAWFERGGQKDEEGRIRLKGIENKIRIFVAVVCPCPWGGLV